MNLDQVPPTPVAAFAYDRTNQIRVDGLSSSLQLAKAGEHLAVAELILQGYNAFIADAQLPYDIIIDFGDGTFGRVQVKSTCDMIPFTISSSGKARHPTYRFAIRRSRQENRRIKAGLCDYFAFVALDIRKVALMKADELVSRSKTEYSLLSVELKTRQYDYSKLAKVGKDPNVAGRFIEDYLTFKR